MPRHKDLTVSLPAPWKDPRGTAIHEWDTVKVAALYDLRDELKENNRRSPFAARKVDTPEL